MPQLPVPRPALGLRTVAQRWSLATQTRARRNAMVAATSLAQRRAEREDAEAYLAAAVEHRQPAAVEPPAALRRS
jgi:hypothetical protein